VQYVYDGTGDISVGYRKLGTRWLDNWLSIERDCGRSGRWCEDIDKDKHLPICKSKNGSQITFKSISNRKKKKHRTTGLVMRHSSGQIVYCGTPGTVFKSRKIRNTILRPSIWEPAIEKVSKYVIGKHWPRLVFANILKFVIALPLPGKIFFACFWTGSVGMVSHRDFFLLMMIFTVVACWHFSITYLMLHIWKEVWQWAGHKTVTKNWRFREPANARIENMVRRCP